MEVVLHKSLIAKQLFTVLRKKINERPNQRVFIVELGTIRDKQKIESIMLKLRKQNYISYTVSFNILIITATEKCILRIINYDNW